MFKYWIVFLLFNSIGRAKIHLVTQCSHRTPKIVGGLQVEMNELPFVVSLMRRGGHFCGATIIHESWILTAGHCICNGLNKFMQPSQVEGVVGLHSISKYLQNVTGTVDQFEPMLVRFKSVLPHPQYKCANVKNDIALLELQKPIKFSHHIQPTCLTIDEAERNHENELAVVSGWGWTQENQEEGHRADSLRKAIVKIWNNGACDTSYQLIGNMSSFISDTQMCAGFEFGGIDACWADSGGPLISSENVLVGVVSTGIGCARPGLPGIYTRVSKYTSWIASVILKS